MPNLVTPQDYIDEKKKVLASFPYFLANYVWIKDEQTFREFKMEPYPWQLREAAILTDPDNRFHIRLKGRQIGFTWLAAAALSIWTALRKNANVLILSKRQDDAQKAMERAYFVYTKLPRWLRPAKMKKNESELVLGFEWDADLDTYSGSSTISALPATADAGRSETGSLVICDEWAFHPYGDENWSSIYATIELAGRFVGFSTANGDGNIFAETYWAATNGENDFSVDFHPYWRRAERDSIDGEEQIINDDGTLCTDWYDEAERNNPDQRRFQQEFPRRDTEAFASSGGCIFDIEALDRMAAEAAEHDSLPVPESYVLLSALDKQYDLEIFELPNPQESYVSGTDIARGRTDTSDYSCTVVMNARTTKVACILWGHIDMDEFGSATATLNQLYGHAFWGPEMSGGWGDAVLIAAKQAGYPMDRVYHYIDHTQKDPKKRHVPGWPTSRKTKPLMESRMQSAIKYGEITAWSSRLVQEFKTYVEDPKTQKTGAKGRNKDDRAIATMIALSLSFEPEAQRLTRKRQRTEPDLSQRGPVIGHRGW